MSQHYLIPRYTVSLVRDGSVKSEDYPLFHRSQDIYTQFKDMFNALDREHFMILVLDTKNRLIGLHDISTGSLSSSVVHPREVFKHAILNNASAFIAMHNHPSGDPEPSREDRECTHRLTVGAQILGIKFLDHIVFGEATYYSFADSGNMGEIIC
jgi:DNA repair protein RadC